jgi:hypothetical protein
MPASSFVRRRARVIGRAHAALRRLERRDPVFELPDLEQVGRGHRRRDEGAQTGDAVVETEAIGDDDLQEAADALHRVQARQVIGDRDGALLAPTQAAHPAGLGGIGGPFGVMREAIGSLALGRHAAGEAVGSSERAAPAAYHGLALVIDAGLVTGTRCGTIGRSWRAGSLVDRRRRYACWRQAAVQ